MKRILMFLLLVIPNIGFCCPSLDGTWTSSLTKFLAFNTQWANVKDNAWSYMIQTQGVEVVKFNEKNEMIVNFPDIELNMGDKKMKRPASEEHITFSILGCTTKSIAIQYERYGEKQISQLHFESDDTYWVYMGRTGADGNSHIREYYTRSGSK